MSDVIEPLPDEELHSWLRNLVMDGGGGTIIDVTSKLAGMDEANMKMELVTMMYANFQRALFYARITPALMPVLSTVLNAAADRRHAAGSGPFRSVYSGIVYVYRGKAAFCEYLSMYIAHGLPGRSMDEIDHMLETTDAADIVRMLCEA